MQTSKWGHPGWEFLHSIAHNYPLNPTVQDRVNYKLFYEHLQNMLPCRYCRESYSRFIKEIPIDPYLSCRDGVITWVYLIHNLVNDKLRDQGYPIPKNPSLKRVIQKYDRWRAECGKVPGKKGKSCRIPVLLPKNDK